MSNRKLPTVAKSIVFCADYNGRSAFFMMKHSDFRFAGDKYALITSGSYSAKTKQFSGDNGHTYRIFSDWSAKDVT